MRAVFRYSPSIKACRYLAPVAALAWLHLSPPTHAQTITSRPVVQPLPSQDTQRLNRALVTLAKKPRDMAALLEAGNAALSVGDLDAALGFFGRAREVDPEEAMVALGLAQVYLRSGRPATALPLFDEARNLGASLKALRSDRALALDMLGDQARAQPAYLAVIKVSPNDNDARRRLALSYAISGNLSAFETTLRPLLDRRDFAAFRARAFGLAIRGEQTRAAAITEAVMPRTLSTKITPYLEFMPRLTRAQQAAAANLGIFPRAAEIGRDSEAVTAYRETNIEPVGPVLLADEAALGSSLEASDLTLDDAVTSSDDPDTGAAESASIDNPAAVPPDA